MKKIKSKETKTKRSTRRGVVNSIVVNICFVVVGSIVMGPIGGVVLGGACAYATTRENSKIGDFSRKWGNRVYSGMVKTKRFIERKLKNLDDRDSRDTVEPIAVATEAKPDSGYATGYSSSNSASQKV